MTVKITSSLVKLLKNAKVKFMIGASIGTLALSGGDATISYAQSNDKSISSEFDINNTTFDTDLAEEEKINQDIFLAGYDVGGKYDIGLNASMFENIDIENYVYDMYMIDENGQIIKKVCEDAQLDYVNGMVEAGKYYAVVKDKEAKEIYGTTPIIDTKVMTNGSGEASNTDLNVEERDLTTITQTGGALTGQWYIEYAHNLSEKTGLDYEMLKDTIVNLHLPKIDETQISVLYPEEINYTKLEESTDYILWNLSEFNNAKLYNFAAENNDLEVLKVLDNKFLNMKETLGTTSYDCETIKECVNFFLAGGKINDITFEQLSDTGKKLALVGYDRLRDSIDITYRHCVDNDVAITAEYEHLYQVTNSMNLLSVATCLDATQLISNYYSLVRECTDSNRLIAFEIDNDLDRNVMQTVYKNNLKGLNIPEDIVKSTYFITNLNSLDQFDTINNFGLNIDIHNEFANMEEYINTILKHNATHDISKNISLVDISCEADKYDVAYLESFYKTLKFEMDNNQLNEKHASAILKWVNEYYNGTYLDNPGVEVRYFDNFTNSGKFIANAMLNQYKILFNNYSTDNQYLNNLIYELKSITLFDETKGAEQIMYDKFEQLEQSLNYYTVKKGDTLSKISRMYHVSVKDLVELNNIENPDLIFPGEVFKTNLTHDYEMHLKK